MLFQIQDDEQQPIALLQSDSTHDNREISESHIKEILEKHDNDFDEAESELENEGFVRVFVTEIEI